MENKPVYHIATVASGQPHTGEVFTIAHDRPEGAPSPETHGQVVYLPGEGLEVLLWCREENPRAVYFHPNEPVHTDSCLEAFLDCFPELPQYGYIGLEMNANGAAHCSFGTDRHNRRYVLDLGLTHPEVQIERFTQDGTAWWRATCLLKQSLLESLYERSCDFPAGHRMRGNFYKCGDLTDAPHWGSWAPVERVDFHVPHLFGEMIVTAAGK